ncbi:MAG: metallophosphoesterase [Myxococcales bacterium]|nr:metallophosphoesterase [Myxococcales bacterium]
MQRAVLGLCVSLAACTPLAADSDEPDEPVTSVTVAPRGTPYALSPWRWIAITAPHLAPSIGALGISGLDVAAGRAEAPLRVLGEGTAPPDWPFALDEGLRAPALPAATADERVAVGYGITTFSLGDGDRGVEMLELRVRYTDGLIAWINGVPVARRSLGVELAPTSLALRPHGPEWETFYIPVVPSLLRAGVNTLAIEVHPSARNDAPALAAELYGRSDRGILRGPIVAAVGATTARIAVETDLNTDASIEWGVGGALDQKAASPPGHHHSFELANLPVKGVVRYRVRGGATQSPIYAFHTAPAAGDVIRIGIYGDVRGGHAVHKKLVDQMLAEPLDLVAVTGDMVLHGSDEADWQRFFTITAPLVAQVPYLPAVGNHDLGWDGADTARNANEVFTLPPGPPDRPAGTNWYSLDVGDVHLVFLDSNAYERPEQETWLAADLVAARARGVRAIIAFTHDGPYSRGYHRGNGIARQRYVPILVQHHVDYVFSGHDHLYQRGEAGGLRYAVTGGGGASLYGFSCGVSGKPACKLDDGMIAIAREHHYAVLTLTAKTLELCVRKPDGRLLEPCSRAPLWRP